MPNESFKSSRFLLWDKPMSYPKFDLVTRDTNPGPVFDLSVELESYDGSVYVKAEHIIEMARSLGMYTVQEAEQLQKENAELRRQINKLPKVQEELKNGLDDLTARFFASLNTIDSEPDDSDSDTAQDVGESEEAESASERSFNL